MIEIRTENLDSRLLRPEQWDELVAEMHEPNIFMSHAWIHSWYSTFHEEYETKVVYVLENDKVLSILPLCRHRKGTFRNYYYCGSLELFPDHLDLISKNGDRRYMDAIFQHLKNEDVGWDTLSLLFLAEEGGLADYLHRYQKFFALQWRKEESAPFIRFDGKAEDYVQSFKKKKRYNLNREERNLDGKGVELYKTENESQLESDLAQLFYLHERRAEVREIRSTFCSEMIKRFHQHFARELLKKNQLGLYFLRVEGVPVSALYGFELNNKFSFYQSGLDPDWEQYSVGKILIYKVLKDITQNGCHEFDFLGGEDRYKTYWTKDARRMESCKVYNSNMKGKILRGMDLLKEKVKRLKK